LNTCNSRLSKTADFGRAKPKLISQIECPTLNFCRRNVKILLLFVTTTKLFDSSFGGHAAAAEKFLPARRRRPQNGAPLFGIFVIGGNLSNSAVFSSKKRELVSRKL
jgi:hypothetical protein